ncbi:MAG: SGNH/GDSL hydrolase family protein, partial [Candidatus Omnitrophica bacterium]|nr:SGNH/GDSL hydrolase family protein [Candidatus Omnitrophota bacterium]
GWKGAPSGNAVFVTKNNKTVLRNNSFGYRDVEHEEGTEKEIIVFLGDSFTWGHEVQFDEMFVNILRDKLSQYEIFNLSHRGHGTDQQLLTLKRWHYGGPVKLVILMFSENDFGDNNSIFRYGKPKPKYEFYNNKLVLTNIPVPKAKEWEKGDSADSKKPSLSDRVKWLILQSHFVHDISFRIINSKFFKTGRIMRKNTQEGDGGVFITKQILKELRDDAIERNGKLLVIAIPSKEQILQKGHGGHAPYQLKLEEICKSLDIDYMDLAPDFKKAFFRTYYRLGMHWNNYGNRVAANAIYNCIKKEF